jgi:hypothetical protein
LTASVVASFLQEVGGTMHFNRGHGTNTWLKREDCHPFILGHCFGADEERDRY